MADDALRERRPPGRPRDTRVHHAVLDAALDLLAEKGWSGLTMEGVAARAGTAKGTVYRWWSSKEQLVIEALLVDSAPYRQAPDTGSFRGDLAALLRGVAEFLNTPRARVLTSLLFETSRNQELADALREHLVAPRRRSVAEIVERAVRRGELRADVDVEVLVDAGTAQLLFRFLVTHEPLTDDLADRVVDLIVRGAAPPG